MHFFPLHQELVKKKGHWSPWLETVGGSKFYHHRNALGDKGYFRADFPIHSWMTPAETHIPCGFTFGFIAPVGFIKRRRR